LQYNINVEKEAAIFSGPRREAELLAISKAQQQAVHKYVKANYDRVELTMPKGKKEHIKAHAAQHDGGSVNAFINRAIDETMERDQQKAAQEESK